MEKMVSFERSRSTAHSDFNTRKSGAQTNKRQHIDRLNEELERIDHQLDELRQELLHSGLSVAQWDELTSRINAMDCRRMAFVREIRDTEIAMRSLSDKMKRSLVGF